MKRSKLKMKEASRFFRVMFSIVLFENGSFMQSKKYRASVSHGWLSTLTWISITP